MPTYLKRTIEDQIRKDISRKMVFLAGPRQTGKTTLALHLFGIESATETDRYLNWDVAAHREKFMNERFPSGCGPLILDEIHKYSRWRQVVKGLFDMRKNELQIIVTGSARLDHYRRGGDSLQGRYHFFRSLPLTLYETGASSINDVESMMHYGGFPEPFLLSSEQETRRWSREYRSRVLQEDLSGLERVMDIALVERLVMRMPELVGSPLSLNGLREDLDVSHQTVSRWVQLLENIYMIFRVYPFGSSRLRSVRKEAKHYHFDWTVVPEWSSRFENLVGCNLLARCFYAQDVEGRDWNLMYFRDTDKREVDFVLCDGGRPIYAIECKLRENHPAVPLRYFKTRFPEVNAVQLVLSSDADVMTRDGIRVCGAHRFFRDFFPS
ncbi:MAG: ATP-binding protein [Chitinispirillaceae bacterium]|nr:ATP-binding protein [Chitinispirillaceae bacterium]